MEYILSVYLVSVLSNKSLFKFYSEFQPDAGHIIGLIEWSIFNHNKKLFFKKNVAHTKK